MQIPDVPPQLLSALVEAVAGQRLALVGGVVRDLLLHRHHQDPWRGLPDLDLVVEGRAADLVERLPKALEQHLCQAVPLRQQQHGRYGTVAVELQLPPELGGTWLLDLASARQEVYPRPCENPLVSPGSLEQDLARRDFSVNAMALVLPDGAASEPQLLDPHGGQHDLAARQLRFLHHHSLRDDPTRLLRAARYAARLGFGLAPDALQQAASTLEAWPWPWRPGDPPQLAPPALATRLRMELELLLEREPWRPALAALQAWGGLTLLDPALQTDHLWRWRLVWAGRLGVPPLLALVAGAADPLGLAQRLQLPHGQQVQLRQWLALRQALARLEEGGSPRPDRPSAWCAFLEQPGFSPQAVLLALLTGVQPRRPLLRWWLAWRHVRSPQDGLALMREGWAPGEALGSEMRRRRSELLDGSVSVEGSVQA
jgi:poly(A) polymerase